DGNQHLRSFSTVAEARMAFDAGQIALGTPIRLRLTNTAPPLGHELPEEVVVDEQGVADRFELDTTLGRAIFNDALPVNYPYVNDVVEKKRLSGIVNDLAERYTKVQVAASLDALKDIGYHWATRSGTTVAVSDVQTPARKTEILAGYESKASKVQLQYERGLITDDERRQKLVEIWRSE